MTKFNWSGVRTRRNDAENAPSGDYWKHGADMAALKGKAPGRPKKPPAPKMGRHRACMVCGEQLETVVITQASEKIPGTLDTFTFCGWMHAYKFGFGR